jgi:hypothetical protein
MLCFIVFTYLLFVLKVFLFCENLCVGIDHGVFCVIDEVFSSRFALSLDEEFCLGESRSGVREVFVWKLGGQMRLRVLGGC